MELLAAALLAVFVSGYLVLAGADIGVGMLLPVLGRDAGQRRLVLAGIAPFFLGNEVWLVAAAGMLAGAFPGMEHRLLTGLFPLFAALLAGWVVRDSGLWLRGRVDARAWRAGCDGAIVAGSWALALSWAALLGTVATDAHGLGFGTVAALPAAALFALHGAAFTGLRLTGAPRERARRIPGRYALTAPLLAVAAPVAGARLPWASDAAGDASLTLTVTAVLVLLPLLLASQALVWWTFRGRVDRPSYL